MSKETHQFVNDTSVIHVSQYVVMLSLVDQTIRRIQVLKQIASHFGINMLNVYHASKTLFT